MSIENRIVAVKRSVEADLRRHANAHAVGVGLKFVNGKATGDLAIQLFVERKRPLLDLPEAERVPREIEGIQTDVIETPPPILMADTGSHRPLRGGTQIGSLPGPTSSSEGGFPRYLGTLGCIAASTEPDGSSRIVALSNYHVLMNLPNKIGSHAGQPDVNGCGECCDNVIGTILRAKRENGGDIDAAIVALNPGLQWKAEIEDIGPIKGTHRPLEAIDLQPTGYPIKKCGRTTGLTKGNIVSVCQSGDYKENGVVVWSYVDQMGINSESASTIFIDHGDSGSVVVNNDNEVVALLWGGDPSGLGAWASPIEFVISQFNISICTATEKDVVNTVPGSPVQSHRTLLGGESVHSFVHGSRARLDALSRHGIDVDRWLHHAEEVRTLILTNRRVAAAWRRLRGPEVFRFVLGEPSEVRASDMESNWWSEIVNSFLVLLNRHGSAALRADLPEFRRVLDHW